MGLDVRVSDPINLECPFTIIFEFRDDVDNDALLEQERVRNPGMVHYPPTAPCTMFEHPME
jgi:hypothetical protein